MAARTKQKPRSMHEGFNHDKRDNRPVVHQGETVEQFKARGGKVTKLAPGIAFYAVGFTTKWPGGRP